MTEPRIIQSQSNNDYHESEGISSSQLKNILKSPAYYKHVKNYGIAPTAAMSLGTAIHTYYLEPTVYESSYTLAERTITRGAKKGETEVKLDSKYEFDYPSLTASECEKFSAMILALDNCEEAQDIRNNAALVEASFYIEHESLIFKCKPDLITKDGWIIELKTVGGMKEAPSAPDRFCYDFFDMNYDLQMFFYKKIVEAATGKKFKGVKFVCVDAKKPVSGVKIYTFHDEDGNRSKHFEIGGHKFEEAIKILKECENSGNYYTYKEVEEEDLQLSYAAEKYLTEHRSEEDE